MHIYVLFQNKLQSLKIKTTTQSNNKASKKLINIDNNKQNDIS